MRGARWRIGEGNTARVRSRPKAIRNPQMSRPKYEIPPGGTVTRWAAPSKSCVDWACVNPRTRQMRLDLVDPPAAPHRPSNRTALWRWCSGQPATAMATPTPMGAVRVERVRGRSALTRCFARYPLKLIAPSRVGPSSCDAVWLYALTYGGGIVSVSPRTLPILSILARSGYSRFGDACCSVTGSCPGAAPAPAPARALAGGHRVVHGQRRRRLYGGDHHAGLDQGMPSSSTLRVLPVLMACYVWCYDAYPCMLYGTVLLYRTLTRECLDSNYWLCRNV